MKCIVAVVCTILAGIAGLWVGALLDVAESGAIICAIACMGGFILSSIENR